MTEKRFRHMRNRLGMQFIGYDEKYVLLGTFADAEGVKYIVDLLNQLNDENEQLKKDRFICLDCEHSGYTEIGCLCEYNDHWQDYIYECEDFKEWQRND